MNNIRRVYLSELCDFIAENYEIRGASLDLYIDKIATPNHADEYSLIFISPSRKDKQALFDNTKARVVICDDSIQISHSEKSKCLIIVKDPKYIFAKIGNQFFIQKPDYTIHPSAIIHPEAIISDHVHIGPHVYIGQCELKENTIIYGHCYLYDNVVINENVTINAGCIIGASGCGQIKNGQGLYEPFPHIGGVVIEAGVEIGTHTCIARGALGNTIIKNGAVIDSFVQIGHNVLIEENVLILANTVVAGSSIIKKDAILAIGAHICDYVTIGEGAHIGPGVVVMSDVSPGAKVVARPPLTVPRHEWNKNEFDQGAA